MSASEEQRLEEFARRTRNLLQHSVDHLDGATRSRLTRARYAALEQARAGGALGAVLPQWRRWLPAGAIAATALAVLIVMGQQSHAPALQASANIAGDDMELLADADGLALTQEADEDYDFYEWAVNTAQDGERGEVGS